MEDIARPLYQALDWSRTLVGGSYALHQYTRDTAWQPNDIDILIDCTSHADFQTELARVCAASACTLEKVKLMTPEERSKAATQRSGPDERFHDSILATSVLRVPGVPLPVQLIGIERTSSNTYGTAPDLLTHLNRITDVPACVSYGWRDQQRIWHLQDRCVEAITTRRVNAWDICAARKDKYTARGYVFYNEHK